MAAVWLRLRAELRTRWRAWLGLAVLVATVSGAVMALAAGARRTDSAYGRFLDAYNAYDVMVLSFSAAEFGSAVFDLDELASLPQVADSARAGHELLTLAGNHLVSPDGRIGTDINRFKVLDGRLADPDRPDEVVLSFSLAEDLGLNVGDTLEPFSELIEYSQAYGPDLAQLVEDLRGQFVEAVPEGVVHIVGITAAPGEFPPSRLDDNRPLIHHTPAFDRIFDPPFSDIGSEALLVRLHGGSTTVDEFLAEVEDRSGDLPILVVAQRDHAATVNRSINLQALALWLLAGLTALTATVILGQVLARFTYLESGDHQVLGALGMTQRERAALGVLRSAAIAVVGAGGGFGVALLASGWFPTGLARIAEPAPGFAADLLVLPAGAALTVAIVTSLSVWPAWRAARSTGQTADRELGPSLIPLAVGRALAGASASVGVGVRLALEPGRGRSAIPVRSTLGGVGLGVVALTAALAFGASLAHLLDTPRLYGVTWDLEVSSFGIADVETKQVERWLDDDRVAELAIGSVSDAAASGRLDVAGERVVVITIGVLKGDIMPPILEGRLPTADDEIVLGARTLRSLDAEVGDVVTARFSGLTRAVDMRVVGTAVVPAVGGALGEGGLVSPDGLAGLLPADYNGELGRLPGVILGLAPGADPEEVAADLAADLRQQFGFEPVHYQPTRPDDIVNFGRVESMPFVLGGILAAISAVTLAHLVVSAVHRRRRDLAILKTLGFVRRQVAATVATQATTVVVIGLAVGIPVGVALGRWVWGLLTDNLGVVSQPRTPVLALVVVAVGGLLLANVIAFLPGQLAARTRPATELRTE